MKLVFFFLLFLVNISLQAQEMNDTVDVDYIGNMKMLPSGTMVRWKPNRGVVIYRDGSDAYVQDMFAGIKVIDAEEWMKPHTLIGGVDVGIYESVEGVPTFRSLHDESSPLYAENEDVGFAGHTFYGDMMWHPHGIEDFICNTISFEWNVNFCQTENDEGTIDWQVDSQGEGWSPAVVNFRVVDKFDVCTTPLRKDATFPSYTTMGILLPDGTEEHHYQICPLADIGSMLKTVIQSSGGTIPLNPDREYGYMNEPYSKLWHCRCELAEGKNAVLYIYDVGDSLIDGWTYTKMKISANFMEDQYIFCKQTGDNVHLYDKKQNRPVRMFDFSLHMNDIVFVDGNRRMKVIEEGYIEDGEQYAFYPLSQEKQRPLKMLRLQATDGSGFEDTWIEGVGSVHAGILSPSFLTENGIQNMDVLYVNLHDEESILSGHFVQYVNQPSFRTVHLDRKDLTQEEFGEIIESQQFQAFDSLEYEFLEDTLHVTGIQSLIPISEYFMECGIQENNVSLQITHALSFPYPMDTSTLQKIDVKIPNFLPGTYTIRAKHFAPVEIKCEYSSSPYDLDGDGTLTLNDITTLIHVYLREKP
ncbi:MAG: hypothetical protein IJT97_03435 [Bacteroidaceae bacterium]|nr:hypothetical protein [Bacteroidaceae bacterium]